MAPQEIIELPTVLVDARTMEVVDEFQLYCRPVHHPQLTPFKFVFGDPFWRKIRRKP